MTLSIHVKYLLDSVSSASSSVKSASLSSSVGGVRGRPRPPDRPSITTIGRTSASSTNTTTLVVNNETDGKKRSTVNIPLTVNEAPHESSEAREMAHSSIELMKFSTKVYSIIDTESVNFIAKWHERLAPVSAAGVASKFVPPVGISSLLIHVTLPSDLGDNPTITPNSSTSIAIIKEDALIMCGWMMKKGGATHIYSGTKYKRRYFELSPSALCYYEKSPLENKVIVMAEREAALSMGERGITVDDGSIDINNSSVVSLASDSAPSPEGKSNGRLDTATSSPG